MLTIKILMIEDHYLKFNGSPGQIVIAFYMKSFSIC